MRMSGVSGSENHLLTLVSALRLTGWASDVIIPSPRPRAVAEYAEVLRNVAGSVDVLREPTDADVRLIGALVRRLRSGRYDVAHAHLAHADLHLAAASLMANVPLVTTKHNHDPFRARQPFRLVEAVASRRYARIIAISESLGESIRSWTGRQAETIRYGLEAGDEPPPRSGFASPVRLLAVGRLEPQKGLDVVLQAVRHVAEAGWDVALSIAGDGSRRRELETLARSLGIDRHVAFLGHRTDVHELMGRADVLVHAARWEGFGLVLLEAMRAALPIVATRVGGIPEVVAEGQTALLVDPEAPEPFAHAILALLADPARALTLGRAGRTRLVTEFSPEQMARRTASVYDELATTSPRRERRDDPAAEGQDAPRESRIIRAQ